ncbi:histone deacetylase complex subunit SAP30L isoform X1 [Cottoperca gobio]|uniref:Histone deacetylase complex subunit SAP30L isoform X1 n=1 Tax=Cottoperca gobio TaxID=56716 RepID=A0A6J2R5G5_COTGO|nr:histone deacetylase complex subunit SAP30L isoform X1 [Cottoperca gobio]
MNGFSTEEDSHDGPPAPPFYGQSCCLIEDGERCGRSAGNASFSKRIQKSISQKKLKLDIDKSTNRLPGRRAGQQDPAHINLQLITTVSSNTPPLLFIKWLLPGKPAVLFNLSQLKQPASIQSCENYQQLTVRHLYICDFHKNFIQSVRNKRKRKTSDDGGESPDHDVEVPEVDLFQLQVNTLRRYKRHYKLQTRPGLNKAQLAETVSRHFRNIPVNEKETLTYFIYMVKSSKSRLDQKGDGGGGGGGKTLD